MVDLTSVVKEGFSFCREVEAVQHERYMYDLGAPQSWQEQIGVGIRVNYRGHLGFSWSEGQYPPSEILRQAAQNAEHGPEGDFSSHRPTASQPAPPSAAVTGLDTAISALEQLIRQLRFTLPAFLPDRSFTINAQLVRDVFSIANRRGFQRDERIAYLLTLRSPQNPPILAVSYASEAPEIPDSLLCQLTWRHAHSLDIAVPETNVVPAYFSPEAAGQFWHDCIQSHWAETDERGAQPFSADSSISLCDDGSLRAGLGTTHIDGEGLPRGRLPLIAEGQPVNILRDTINSRRLGKEAQGTSIRLWGRPPQSGYTNLDVMPGRLTSDQLCQEIADGIWLDYLTPLPEAPPPGIFQRRASIAFLIRQGRPIARLPQFIVQGSYRGMLNAQFIGLGCSARLHGRIKAPSMAVDGLRLIKKEPSPQENSLDVPQLWW